MRSSGRAPVRGEIAVGSARVASLEYSFTDECLTLTVVDENGWLEGRRQIEGNALAGLASAAMFDEIVEDANARTIQLVKRFRPR